MGDAVLEGVPSGHECGAGGRAGGADQKAGEAGALVVEFVEIGSLDPGMAVTSDRAVALVVSHDENDVWFVGRGEKGGEDQGKNQEDASSHGKLIQRDFGGSFRFVG